MRHPDKGWMKRIPKWSANLPLKHQQVLWPRANRTIMMGDKATGDYQAFALAKGQYPVYCQRIGRRIDRMVVCGNENILAAALARFNWKFDYAIIRKAHGVPQPPQPAESFYLPGKKPRLVAFSAPRQDKPPVTQTLSTRAA